MPADCVAGASPPFPSSWDLASSTIATAEIPHIRPGLRPTRFLVQGDGKLQLKEVTAFGYPRKRVF
jgi:hypothetical protein